MMIYDNKKIRRQDRLLEEDRAREILRSAEYGILSLADSDDTVYGIPINFVWDGQTSLYIHCAPEGRKLRCMESHPQVSFCVVGRVNLLPSKFTTEYESIVLTGEAHTDLSDDERLHALTLLLGKLSPDDLDNGLKYAEKSFHRVKIVRIDITAWSGKSKRMHGNPSYMND
jgi:nitroimidazol reductase NimA-like FMN-containing flavoprotein (pyridoxamine 5'-phosphate oxidase superfamily)